MQQVYVLGIVGVVTTLVIGKLEVASLRKGIQKRINYTYEYENHLANVANELNKNHTITNALGDDFQWLAENMNKMQTEVGGDGIISGFKPPYCNYYVKAFHPFLNLTSSIMQGEFYVIGFCANALSRHLGTLKEELEIFEHENRNPLVWLRYGIQFLIFFPLRLLMWLGLLSDTSFSRIYRSAVTKFISGMFALFGLVGTLCSTVSGWDATVIFVKRLLHLM